MTSTIALIEPVAWQYRRIYGWGAGEWQPCTKTFYDEMKERNGATEVRALVPATELTTLLQRCEKAEADATYWNGMFDLATERAELAERQRDEALKALQAVDATAAFNADLGKYMIEPHALDMVSSAIRAGGKP